MILQDFAKSVVSCECQSTTIKPAGLPAQKTPQTGVLEYQWSDVSDVSDKSDGWVGMQSTNRQQKKQPGCSRRKHRRLAKKPPSGGKKEKLPLACRANRPATGATANDVIF